MSTLTDTQRAQIEAYCEGLLPAAEALQVAERLADNPAWMAYAESHRALLQGVDAAVEARFKAALQAHESAQHRPSPDEAPARRAAFAERRILGWLLAILLALGTIVALWWNNRTPPVSPPAVIFAEYFTPPLNTWIVTTRGVADTAASARAMHLYDTGDFEAAAVALAKLAAPEAQWYLGMCLLQMGDYREALPLLRAYREAHPTEAEAHWYFVLNLVALGEIEEARQALESYAWPGAAKARADQLWRDLARE